MTINALMRWLEQFQGWIGLGLVAFPGVLRLQGLMVLVGLGFAGLLAVHKTFIGIHFFARFEHLLAILAGVVALWQFGVARLCRKPRT
jgi:hypothetical protein